jgi:hypothetical protein
MLSLAYSTEVLMGKRKGAPSSQKQQPGFDGRFEEGERYVSDPLNPGRPEAKKVNVRESAIDHMASRGRLDTAQVAAGDRFRRMWELAAIGRQKGIDFEGGHSAGAVNDPLTDELVRAGRALAKAIRSLGMIRSRILISIVGEGKLIEDVARDWSQTTGRLKGKRAEGYITGTLIDAIDDLVRLWKLEGIGQPEREPAYYSVNGKQIPVFDAIRASGPMSYTGPAREISIGKFGDVIVEEKRGLDRGPLTPHVSGNVGGRVHKK